MTNYGGIIDVEVIFMNSNKLKKIIYSILKEILESEEMPTANDYDISQSQFFEIIQLMKNEGYLNPKKICLSIGGSVTIIKGLDTVTMKGIDFLEENNKWNKVYKGIKEFRDFLPM